MLNTVKPQGLFSNLNSLIISLTPQHINSMSLIFCFLVFELGGGWVLSDIFGSFLDSTLTRFRIQTLWGCRGVCFSIPIFQALLLIAASLVIFEYKWHVEREELSR